MTAGDQSVLLSTYIVTGIAVVFVVIVFTQLCVSSAYGVELKALKYRFINCIASIFVLCEAIFSILHFHDTNHSVFVVGFVIMRTLAVFVLYVGGAMFLIAIFDTLYQSRLAQQTAPKSLRRVFKILGFVYPLFLFPCCVLAIIMDQIFWVHLIGLFITVFPSFLAIVVMLGLINVIHKMNDIRRSIESGLKKKPELEAVISNESAHDINSDDPQKHGRARVISLRKKSKQLTITGICLFLYWIGITYLGVTRLLDIKKPSEEGTLYQQVMSFSDYLAALSTQFIALSIITGWVWIKMQCTNHRDRFTVFYLCCMGEPDPELAKQKSMKSVLEEMAKEIDKFGHLMYIFIYIF